MLCSSAVSLLRVLCLRNSGCMCVCVCLRETMGRGGALRDYSRVGCFQFLFSFLTLNRARGFLFLGFNQKGETFRGPAEGKPEDGPCVPLSAFHLHVRLAPLFPSLCPSTQVGPNDR